MRKPNKDRNQELFQKRFYDPRWTFKRLAHFYHVAESTAFEIYHREKAKKSRAEKSPVSRTIASNYPRLVKNRPVGLYPARK